MNHKKIMTKLIGERVGVVIIKTKVFIANNFDVDDGFFIIKGNNETLRVNKNNVQYFSTRGDVDRFGYRVSEYTEGVVIDCDDKFLMLEIHNTIENFSWKYMLPYSNIEGIKIMSNDIKPKDL